MIMWNTQCGEHSAMMAVFGLIESGRVVDAAAGIVATLGSCKCDEAREFLQGPLHVVAQLGNSLEEEGRLFRLCTVVFGSGQERSVEALAM